MIETMAVVVQSLKLNFQSFKRVLFGLLRLGPHCNATKNCSFAEADCDFDCIFEDDSPIAVNFSLLFEPGILFLKEVKECRKKKIHAGVMNHEEIALRKLEDYINKIDYHVGCLRKVISRQQHGADDQNPSPTETEVTAALTEHLLGRLAPGDSRVSDRKVKGKGKGLCQCGCNRRPKYSCTGIGHEEVWHGHVDILFLSCTGEPVCIATVPESSSATKSTSETKLPVKRPRTEDEDFFDGQTGEEVKFPAITEADDQAIAQIIVFSLLQRQKRPLSQHHLIPNIVISPTEFRIYMYDAVNDILLSSLPLQLFDSNLEKLQMESVIILWIVLHYHIFCAGIKVEELAEEFKRIDIQSHFPKTAKAKWDIYLNSLKENVGHFPTGKKRTLISYDTYWRAKELKYESAKN